MTQLGSVRHQILLPEQKAVFDYWRQKCGVNKLPSHQDIDPCLLSPYLSTISLTEICSNMDKTRYKMRLAGLGVLDTSELNNHVLFYLCGRCVSYDSFDADSVKVHLDLECPRLRNKWTSTSELYLVIRAVFLVSLSFIVLGLLYVLFAVR